MDGNSCGRQRSSTAAASFVERALDLAVLAVLDDLVDGLADPRLVADEAAEPQLRRQHVLQLAVLERRELGVRDADGLVQRRAGVGPSALEPPAAGIDAERDQPFERGEASARAARPGRRACAATWPSPPAPTPVRRTAPAGSASTRRRARRRTATRRPTRRRASRSRSAPPGSARDRASSGTAAVRPPDGRGCARTARWAARAPPGRTSAPGGTGWGSSLRRLPRRSTVSSSVPTAPCAVSTRTASNVAGSHRRGSPDRARRRRAIADERLRRRVGRVAGLGDDVGEPDDDVDLSPGAGRALGVRPPAAPSTAGPARGSGTRPAPTGPPRSPRARAPRARRRPRRPRPA